MNEQTNLLAQNVHGPISPPPSIRLFLFYFVAQSFFDVELTTIIYEYSARICLVCQNERKNENKYKVTLSRPNVKGTPVFTHYTSARWRYSPNYCRMCRTRELNQKSNQDGYEKKSLQGLTYFESERS